ncbi:MAG: gas vesicle protein K [Armatimonadetes bacterium]|nr:gas vesicle protein K [Armatimonadota bacterium]
MRPVSSAVAVKDDSEGGRATNGVAQLVLTVIKLLQELVERQALRRIDDGDLTADQIEKLGTALMRQVEELDRLKSAYGLTDDDLNLDLGPLGHLL